MKIMVCGKGGSGKSTVTALMAKEYEKQGKRVLVIDDIYTTGQASAAFIGAMQATGADVLMALFLGRTKLFRKADKY